MNDMPSVLERPLRRPPVSGPEAPRAPGLWLSLGLVALSIGLVVVALLGPLATELIRYRVTETLRNQTIGLDAVSLIVVAPLAMFAAFLVLRGRVAGPLVGLAIGAYAAYMFVQYTVGPDYAHLDGNNERLFPLALFMFTGGWGVALMAWSTLDGDALPLSPLRARLVTRIFLPVLGLATFGRYIPSLIDWMSSAPQDKNYLAGPNFAWAIAMLDLGIFLPLTVIACIGTDRGHGWGKKALYAVVGWFGLVGPAVAAMAITMYVNDDPTASGGNTAFMSILGLTFLALAVFVYTPLVRRRPTPREVDRLIDARLTGARRWVVAGIALAVGVGAVFGGWGLLSDAEAVGVKAEWLDGSPFPDYRIPGLFLVIVIGGGMLLTGLLAVRSSRVAGLAAITMATILLIWGVVETVTIGYQGVSQLLLLALWVVGPALPLLKIGWDASKTTLVRRGKATR
jgi:hypothetical protein